MDAPDIRDAVSALVGVLLAWAGWWVKNKIRGKR